MDHGAPVLNHTVSMPLIYHHHVYAHPKIASGSAALLGWVAMKLPWYQNSGSRTAGIPQATMVQAGPDSDNQGCECALCVPAREARVYIRSTAIQLQAIMSCNKRKSDLRAVKAAYLIIYGIHVM